jgi:putative addiction module CopG family antidote
MAQKDDVIPITISIPRTLKTFINSRVATGEYSSASDYIRELLRLDRRQITSATIGETTKSTRSIKKIPPALWAELRELISSGEEKLLASRLSETAELFEAARTILSSKDSPLEIGSLIEEDLGKNSKFFRPASAERLRRLQ